MISLCTLIGGHTNHQRNEDGGIGGIHEGSGDIDGQSGDLVDTQEINRIGAHPHALDWKEEARLDCRIDVGGIDTLIANRNRVLHTLA